MLARDAEKSIQDGLTNSLNNLSDQEKERTKYWLKRMVELMELPSNEALERSHINNVE
jgi:hypothetical protein